ncbi:MAG TPA: glycosyltransferase [Phycisphaerae bacterium]|jgi:glycosyltransferase involved in cell wall biosynthesis|nr:glycosyltransferase [Phycisphaerae bacterium]HOB76353.1 glycosyltransferase [Phycisphaerae bacterium]HOJ55399.1 glycosyltransferase [Phycisphaerae bacterium]HOL24947.1 glycosyltransferase [Phycisphaerae bacterium]HPP20049.1 glycosyltransferase [Phycisphaerae bacterium]
MPRVSIGMPVYNGERFLAEAIESILAQTFTDFELIISDNGSTDSTPAICERYARLDSRIRYYRNEVNLGAAPNFNRAFHLAQGEYFKWAAHDDICLPQYLERCVETLDADAQAVLCYPRTWGINADGTRDEQFTARLDTSSLRVESPRPHLRFSDMIHRYHLCHQVFGLFRRQVLARTPLIQPYTGSDRVLLAVVALYGTLREYPEYLFLNRNHDRRSVSRPRRERAQWFDTRRSRVDMYTWRTLYEYCRGVMQAPLSACERGRCLMSVAWLAVKSLRTLASEIKWYVSEHMRPQKPAAGSSGTDQATHEAQAAVKPDDATVTQASSR